MAKAQLPHIDVSTRPELARLAEQVRRTNTPTLLTRNDEVLARVSPAPSAASGRRVRRHTHQPDDTLLRLIGIASGPDDGVHDAAEQHDRYLADADADTQR